MDPSQVKVLLKSPNQLRRNIPRLPTPPTLNATELVSRQDTDLTTPSQDNNNQKWINKTRVWALEAAGGSTGETHNASTHTPSLPGRRGERAPRGARNTAAANDSRCGQLGASRPTDDPLSDLPLARPLAPLPLPLSIFLLFSLSLSPSYSSSPLLLILPFPFPLHTHLSPSLPPSPFLSSFVRSSFILSHPALICPPPIRHHLPQLSPSTQFTRIPTTIINFPRRLFAHGGSL